MSHPVNPELLLQAYAAGYFPMAETQDSEELYWFNPEIRCVLPLEDKHAFHLPRSLAKFLRKSPFRITVDTAFAEVIAACANTRTAKRDSTWINSEIAYLYTELARLGHAHSVECWEGNQLVGGLYGVSLGGAFFGESMFSRRTNASKTALAHLVERLKTAGYTLLDAQFENEHLTQFGFRSMEREIYLEKLDAALAITPDPSSRFTLCLPVSP